MSRRRSGRCGSMSSKYGGSGRCLALAVFLMLTFSVLSMPGCGTTSADRVEAVSSSLVFYEAQADAIEVTIEDLKALTTGAAIELSKANTTGDVGLIAKATGVLDEIGLKLLEAQRMKATIDDTVATVAQNLEDIKAGNNNIGLAEELEMYSGIAGTAAPLVPPPYGIVVGAVGALLGGIAQGLRVREGKAFTQVVRGVNEAITVLGGDHGLGNAQELKTILSNTQDDATEARVEKVKRKIRTADAK